LELGIYTFAERTADPHTGKMISAQQRISDLLEEITLADQLGLDVFGIGEHHRPDFVVSSPAVILAAAAVKTKHIKLTSAVTVLSSDDPVRVFQDFASVDLLSSGRAEIMAGRGSFIESFPLFGYDLEDYDTLLPSIISAFTPGLFNRNCPYGLPLAERLNQPCVQENWDCQWLWLLLAVRPIALFLL